MLHAALQMAAPYLAVALFMGVWSNAWLCLLAYHAQVLAWSWRRVALCLRGWDARAALAVGLPCALAGPALWLLLPHMSEHRPAEWLAGYGVSRAGLLLLAPYFGLVHPLLEEAHWSRLRRRAPAAHLLFAGYHLLVLRGLLAPGWLALCFGCLASASAIWGWAERRSGGGLRACWLAHAAADLGIVVAAILR